MLVKIHKGLNVSKSSHANSCPMGWKIFSPQSKADWETALSSTALPKAPDILVDVTSKDKTCTECGGLLMNSGVSEQSSWITQDGTAWWLRGDEYQPTGNYVRKCYLKIKEVKDGIVTFKIGKSGMMCVCLCCSSNRWLFLLVWDNDAL